MIRLEDVSVSFGEQKVLSNINMSLPERGIMLVTGPSGCGKTTLLRVIAGLVPPGQGRVVTGGERISFVFQEDRLLPWYTAKKNVALVSSDQAAGQWLGRVGLSEHAAKLPAQLSGGMRRRVALARGLAYESDVLLLDEPFTGMDRELRRDVVIPLIKEYSAGRPAVLVTHESADIELLAGSIAAVSEI